MKRSFSQRQVLPEISGSASGRGRDEGHGLDTGARRIDELRTDRRFPESLQRSKKVPL
jgi:hypothetical protein